MTDEPAARRDVYVDQWQACADLMRAKAVEFDELAKSAPKRPAPNPSLLDYAKVIEWLWAERHDLGGQHRDGVHLSDFPPGLSTIFEEALRRAARAKQKDVT